METRNRQYKDSSKICFISLLVILFSSIVCIIHSCVECGKSRENLNKIINNEIITIKTK